MIGITYVSKVSASGYTAMAECAACAEWWTLTGLPHTWNGRPFPECPKCGLASGAHRLIGVMPEGKA